MAELTRLARTVRAWETEILAWHTTDGCSNGPTEAVNLLIKKVKRVGHGFRNFAHYRHTTPEMATRLVAAVEERLAVVLATAEVALDQQRPSQR